ncbi:cytochrome c [Litoreibacter ponti]|uniref:Cytochrome c n=1 Tax=Litoreibacter ponti TaxID=1510457 RepID=A0A2T6BH62_9RHOB|nr:c-type cytochrome [Litoreibacter ponti]PTX55405.1 cytochrome c [Litoreibacter ponti]
MRHLTAAALAALCMTPATAQNIEAGAEYFSQYCVACHGTEARGDGPMAQVMIIRPTDLTILAGENDGVFPRAWAIRRIDGTDPLVSHGSPMPVYGPFFEGEGVTIPGEDGVLIMTSQPVVDLIGYLESIQQ